MIEFVKGDMFGIQADIRVNTVNCVGVMGAGVALAFKHRYPDMFKEYKLACKNNFVKPGKLHIWRSLIGDWVVNFPTKRDWRDPSRYEDIESGLDALYEYLKPLGNVNVTLPALGCGHGGLDWNRVSQMIEHKLSDLSASIYVFAPLDSRAAGQQTKITPTEDEILAASDLGFIGVESKKIGDYRSQDTLFVKGDISLLKKSWILLIPSREPSDRELQAINVVAAEIAAHNLDITLALLHANISTEKIASICNDNGVNVVLLLPFGVLTRKSIMQHVTIVKNASTTLLSLTSPSRKWSQVLVSQSMALLKERATSILLSDPNLEWLKKYKDSKWQALTKFYLRYGELSEELFTLTARENVHSIKRRPSDGTPNLNSLISSFQQADSTTLGEDNTSISGLSIGSLSTGQGLDEDYQVKINLWDFPESCWFDLFTLVIKEQPVSVSIALQFANTVHATELKEQLSLIRSNYSAVVNIPDLLHSARDDKNSRPKRAK